MPPKRSRPSPNNRPDGPRPPGGPRRPPRRDPLGFPIAGAAEEEAPRVPHTGKTPVGKLDVDPKKSGADWFKEASRHIPKQRWEAALEALLIAVRKEPSNLLYRKTLRAAACNRYRNNLVGSGQAGKTILRLLVLIGTAQQKKNWQKVDELAESGLALNPWHFALNEAVLAAAEGRGHQEVADFTRQTLNQLRELGTSVSTTPSDAPPAPPGPPAEPPQDGA